MADTALDAAGCGSMVVDLFYRTPRIIGGEEKINLSTHGAGSRAVEQALVGGLTLNHLGWARILGLKTGIFGKMADDRHGRFLRAAMDRFSIAHHLTLDGSASSFAAVFVDARGNRAIYMARGATGELTPAEISERHGAFIRRAQLVSTEISQLPLKTVIAILQFARTNSITSVLDVDIPPSDAAGTLGTRQEFERALALATILKPAKRAAHELMKGAAVRDSQKIAKAMLARYGNRAVIVTDGERGCAIATSDSAFWTPAFRVKQVDATGAGDAFLGGVLAGLRWDLNWEQLARLANAAGAVCVTRLGAFPSGFELRDEILKLYGESLPPAAAEAEAEFATEKVDRGAGAEVAEFFEIALAELASLKDQIELDSITRAVELIRESSARSGRVHVTGVGKPEHVARYVASLFSSIGTPATFLHATETLHGSLGQVHPQDVVVAISNSGGTAEMCTTARAIKEHGATLIAVTGGRDSELAEIADLVIHAPVAREGGGLGLAPRASILAEVMVLAGLSVALEVARGLTAEEYSRWHRAGALGAAARRLAGGRGTKS